MPVVAPGSPAVRQGAAFPPLIHAVGDTEGPENDSEVSTGPAPDTVVAAARAGAAPAAATALAVSVNATVP
jgi:hypothetical protein